ncbi:hypothetical protein BJ912DRAFT_158514 [Pholiota molesta]|nr:hypothetical protein BJ912DRAFT_158514 [Pholiota molesta]
MALSPEEEEESQITGAVPPKDDTAIASLPLVSRATRKRPALLAWLASPQTIYAFRVAFLSIALYSLGLCKKTASTYFSYGGFVSTILAQSSYVGIYAGDQVFFFIVRLCATVEALLFALGGWLSTAGEGPINPYAFVVMATMTCLCTLLITVSSSKRTHILFGVIFSTTVITTLVFTWGEVKLNTAPPLQIVFKNIWLRALLDVIGFVASAIVMMIPFPVTSRRGFHDTLSSSLIELNGFVQYYRTKNTTPSSPPDDSRAEIICSMMQKQETMEHF